MGLTKQYLRYAPDGVFNIIASQNCNLVFITWQGQEGRYVAVGGCEDVLVWDFRLGEKVLVLPGEKFEVTRLAASPNKKQLAAGYADGSIKIFDLATSECACTFSGHRSSITCLTFNHEGHLLASGSKDTEVIVWDVVAERGQHRLSGHKGAVTQVRFMSDQPVLVSSSKDALIKFWDLDTSHCFKTLVGHKTEVWDLVLMCNDKYLVSGSSDAELSVWQLSSGEDEEEKESKTEAGEGFLTGEDHGDTFGPVKCRNAGSVLRSGCGRLQALTTDDSGHILACHASDFSVELFRFCTEEEAQARLKRRKKKEKKKTDSQAEAEDQSTTSKVTLSDEVRRLTALKTSDRVKACHLVVGQGGEIRVGVVLRNNLLELHSVVINKASAGGSTSQLLRSLDKRGHRSEVRAICFSSDGLAVATGSAEAVKMWNRPSQSCLRTLSTGYVLSLKFVPGDRHLLVGLKDGTLLIADIATADILEEVPAHEKEIWSIAVMPDQRGCATGSGDKSVKFWDFDLVMPESSSKSRARVLSLLHTRSLQLEEGVLCVCISPNARLVAAALLDSTVKIFFLDTLKFFVSLYGHKLPVLCMDICYDSTIICTGSADRNVKVWGLDFGDCHKSIFAHEDTVTSLQFVPKTHYFFTCGKDGKVKQWDGDTYERILTLQGHQGAAHCLAVSSTHVVSCGADRVVRTWERSSEPLVLEDEREEERQQEEETALATGTDSVVPGQPGHNLPSRKTVGAEKAAELLLEGIQLSEDYRKQLEESASQSESRPQAPPLMSAMGFDDPDEFLLDTLRRVRASDLEEALLLLPFSTACQLLVATPGLLRRGAQTEVVLRTLSFLMRVHHEPIVGTKTLFPILVTLKSLALKTVDEARDRVGTNLYGLQMRQRRLEAEEQVQVFKEASQRRKEKDRKRRRKERAVRRAVMSL